MKSRYSVVVLAAAVIVLLWGLLFGGPHSAQGAGPNVVVLCSACAYGEARGLALLDANTGDVWIYTDQAWEGKAKPFYWGKLALGQPLARGTK
jgi:hypothetical protein